MLHNISLIVYNLTLKVYWCGIYAASFVNGKAKLWIAGRKNWWLNTENNSNKTGKRYWFHCASLGEFEQARPVLEKLSGNNNFILLTFFSPSGFEIQKNYAHADVVMYLPLDSEKNARHFINCYKPDVAMFVKYEFWHHYLSELSRLNIPVVLFSSVFRKDQIFFKWYGTFFRNILSCFTKIFVQNAASQKLISSISIESELCYDSRFDRVIEVAESKRSFPVIEKFCSGSKIFIAGSTWPKDETLILHCIHQDWLKEYKYIIAPHQVASGRLNDLKKQLKVRVNFLSELTETNASETDVVIVDSIGQLSSLYAYAHMAYVGGGFNSSVHNILEAAVYGLPVLYGPNHQKSEEAKDLLRFWVTDIESFRKAITETSSENLRVSVGSQNRKYVYDRKGGAEKIYSFISKL